MGALVVLGAVAAHAATETEKKVAIDAGLEWLAQTQNLTTGGWESAGDVFYDTAATGASLLSFLEEGHKAGTAVVINGTDYGDVVGRGLTYLFNKATPYAISVEPAGNPDADGNGIGVKFVTGGNNNRDTYVTGLVLPAIASTGTPNAIVTTGPLAGRTDGSGPGGAWTYKDVVQNTVDYFAYGQADSGTARGGWRYYADYNQSDNSTAQWPVIGMLFAEKMGVTAPQFVKDELKYWIAYIQNPNGGSGYDNPNTYVNVSKTGGLLAEMYFAGVDLGDTAYDTSHPDVQAALAFIDDRWQNGPSSTWYGNFAHPYAMWSAYKGLEVMIGLEDTAWITNLHAAGVIDPEDTWNWWEDYCEWLVNNQTASGYWDGYPPNWNAYLATPWNINILAATEVAPPPPIPEPVTMAGLVMGVGGLVAYVRRRRR